MYRGAFVRQDLRPPNQVFAASHGAVFQKGERYLLDCLFYKLSDIVIS